MPCSRKGGAPADSRCPFSAMRPQPGVAQSAIVPPKNRIAKPIYKKIAKVHNSMEGHWGLDICKRRLNDPSIPDKTIREFIRQCPSCIPIITRRFTCASYHPFTSAHSQRTNMATSSS